MGDSLGRVARISEWVFPAVPASYDESHPLLVRFPVPEADLQAAGILLGKSMLPDDQRHRLGSMVSTCILFFHANGCDAGQCLEDMMVVRDGGFDGDAVVLVPEYPGYGVLREYEPSVAGINLIANAAWGYCRTELGFMASQIMIWGRSIGTGPATELAYCLSASFAARRPPLGLSMVDGDGKRGASPSLVPSPPPGGSSETAGILAAKLAKFEAAMGPESPSGEAAATPGLDKVCVGAEAIVQCEFYSDSAGRALLQVGQRGHVLRIDVDGDALVDFEDHEKSQWIFRRNLGHLRFEERPVGGLALIAPLTSVADVVQHHIQSEFAASLVGPMWTVLDRIQEPLLDRVPLLVIHPKQDEIVPSTHGQQIYEGARTRRKFGVWLCNAMHNIPLEEDHFKIARPFLREAVVACAAIVHNAETFAGRADELDGDLGEVATELMALGLCGKAEELVMMSL